MIEQLLLHLEAEPEPVQRARLATEHIAAMQKARRRLAWLRMQAIAELKDHTDLSNRAIGSLIGVSANAVQQAHDEARGRPRRKITESDE